ncbi:hypothetical protein [Roseomonas populi]|uniref:Uncharacterized protein n=1 Tax=Roseomonas populi TaxID=3121582 RepID=A0ABT1X2U8_9PROT|nr:hypothetical protein [Roseomonas pecuniae]MCR0982111.1 hypothetical protein [Roseomonas pecuniae]
MPSDPIRSGAATRDQAAASPDAAAPAGMAEARHPSPRPIAHAEEGEGGRGEWWSLIKAVLIGVVVLMLLGWLISG